MSTSAVPSYYPAPGVASLPLASKPQVHQDSGVTRSMHPVTTGTSVLGVKFNGGVAIAADMLGSYGSLARFPAVSRICKVNENTVVGAGGDYADFQAIKEGLEMMMIESDIKDDGYVYSPDSIFAYLRCWLYQRRSKFDPLWNTCVVAGFHKGASYLGYVDKLGVAYTDETLATGYGAYIARPLMRNALEAKEGDLSKEEAVHLLEECLKVLYYRDARSINKFEIAVVTETGVDIQSDRTVETNWEVAHYVQGYE